MPPPTRKLPTKNVEYRATVKTNNSVKQYIGATEGTLKQRICSHILSFSNRNYSSNTSLSTHIWSLKDMNNSPTITLNILKQASANKQVIKKCLLRNFQSPITKHPAKQKNRDIIQMPTWEQLSTLIFRPIHITKPHLYNPPYQYHLH